MSVSKFLDDGTIWPIPGGEMYDLSHRLRYPPPGVSPEYDASSIIEAYCALIRLDQRTRNKKIAMIRKEKEAKR